LAVFAGLIRGLKKAKKREDDVELAKGQTTPQVCKKLGSASRRITAGGENMAACAWNRQDA